MLTSHQAVVLAHLTCPNHAYAVAQEINATGPHVIAVETCYRTVATLTRAGYIERTNLTNPPTYQITPHGNRALLNTIGELLGLANYLERAWLQHESQLIVEPATPLHASSYPPTTSRTTDQSTARTAQATTPPLHKIPT